jgi:hypothetical protein
MGSRGYRGGDECDAFSRYARSIRGWKRGELRLIKRRFSKRSRRKAHETARCREGTSDVTTTVK